MAEKYISTHTGAQIDAAVDAIASKQDALSAAQLAAANSGITASKVETYDGYDAQIQNKSDLDHTHPATDISGLKNIATSGEYSDIYNVPTAGSGSNPVYFGTDATTSTGKPFACNFSISTAGNATTPVYFKFDSSDGLIKPTAFNANIGTNVSPVYMSNGRISQCDTAEMIVGTAGTLTNLTATVTELNYCDGVTSDIQTQLDNKFPLTGGTLDGGDF